MKARSKIVLIIGLIATIVGCAKTHRVVEADAAADGDYVYYNLPQTVIVVTAKGTITEAKPSPDCGGFSDHMEYFDLVMPKYNGKVLTVSDFKIAKRSEPDPSKKYAVQIDSKSASTLTLTMNSFGIPTKAGSEATSNAVPIAKSLIKLVGTAALALAPADPTTYCNNVRAQLIDVRQRLLDLDSSPGATDPKEIISLKAAKLMARKSVLESKYTGVAPGTPATIVCEVVPSSIGKTMLFEWSMSSGVTALGSATGVHYCAIPSSLSPTFTSALTPVKILTKHVVSLNIDKRNASLAPQVQVTKPNTERSFRYRVPRVARVYLDDQKTPSSGGITTVLLSTVNDWNIAQLGNIHSLPRLSTKSSAKVSLTFDPATGAMTELGITRGSMDTAGLIGSVTDQYAAYATAKSAEAAKDTELLDLQRQQSILEAQVAIQAAEDTLRDD